MLQMGLPTLPARCLACSSLSGLHLAEPILATGTQRTGVLILSHGDLARDHSVANVGTVDTSTVHKARR